MADAGDGAPDAQDEADKALSSAPSPDEVPGMAEELVAGLIANDLGFDGAGGGVPTSPKPGELPDPDAGGGGVPEQPGEVPPPEEPQPPSDPRPPETDEAGKTAADVIFQHIEREAIPFQLPWEDDEAGGEDSAVKPPLAAVVHVIYVGIDQYLLAPGAEIAGAVKQSTLNLLGFLRGFACSFLCSDDASASGSYLGSAPYKMAAASQVAVRDTNLVALAAVAATGTGLASLFPGFRRLLRYGGIALLSRIPAKDILKSDVRRAIHEIVCANPGIALNEIVEQLDLSRNAVAYHLAVFEHEKEVVSVKDGKYRRYFQNGGKYTNGAKIVVSALRNDKTLEVAKFISDHPGAIQKQVCAAIGTSPSATNWHIQRLEKVGLVTKEREANTVKYFPGQAVEKYDLAEFGLERTTQPAVTAPSVFATPTL